MVKAAVLLARVTRRSSYLQIAEQTYAAIRANFLDPQLPLYTTYVFDDGFTCQRLPHRFFASVNGDMIWSGVQLATLTGNRAYLSEARSTAAGVEQLLVDGRGVFTDLQAENDVVEPLVEGMLALARRGDRSARAWILSNASAAQGARTRDGSFGRFFDGPVPTATVTAWQTNGGLALQIAAGDLAPRERIHTTVGWSHSVLRAERITTLPATLTFVGSGIALYGTLGAVCCERGHARVLIDGQPPVDLTGIWQNKSSLGRSIPGTILFAWRWPRAGQHVITFLPGVFNPKEGGSFLHLTGYRVLR